MKTDGLYPCIANDFYRFTTTMLVAMEFLVLAPFFQYLAIGVRSYTKKKGPLWTKCPPWVPANRKGLPFFQS